MLNGINFYVYWIISRHASSVLWRTIAQPNQRLMLTATIVSLLCLQNTIQNSFEFNINKNERKKNSTGVLENELFNAYNSILFSHCTII
jgi:hypothetical protein